MGAASFDTGDEDSRHAQGRVLEHAAPTRREARAQLLFFYDPADGRARRVDAFLAQVLQSRRNHNTFTLRRIDVRKHAKLAERFRVHASPSLVVVAEGRVQCRLEVPSGCRVIATFLDSWLR